MKRLLFAIGLAVSSAFILPLSTPDLAHAACSNSCVLQCASGCEEAAAPACGGDWACIQQECNYVIEGCRCACGCYCP